MPDACWPTSVRLAGELCLVHTQGGGLLPRHRVGEGFPAGKSSMGLGLQQEKAPPEAARGGGPSTLEPSASGPHTTATRSRLRQLCPFFEMESSVCC